MLTGPVVPPFAGSVLITVPIPGSPFDNVTSIYVSFIFPKSISDICILAFVNLNEALYFPYLSVYATKTN